MTAENFDDGRTDVPGGLTGPVERVVVVGAGSAGLTVANALAHAGVGCVVVEARDRVGGRLHTVDLAGSPVDLHAIPTAAAPTPTSPPGASPADADLLGEPVGGRLLFAGEHTQSARLAYADGAMTSGIREAKRLLSQPSVHLGPVVTGHIRSE
ncbi:MAG TPA: FAD-dependent oxidoreductase [Streptosporangiaceae bacterium]|nr:FAD-dependent oxidoreductase [Streptosporangiaceae bacterium]